MCGHLVRPGPEIEYITARMTSFDFPGSTAVRADLQHAYEDLWRHLAAPGTWFDGTERVAIAAETRAARGCSLCHRRKQALSPYAVDGEHDRTGDSESLAPQHIDMIHRLATDSGRLSKPWFLGVCPRHLSEGEYVETVALVSMVTSFDTFWRGVGAEPPPLLEPLAGEPSRIGARRAVADGAWIPRVPNPKIPGVGRALSLVPAETAALARLTNAQYTPTRLIIDVTKDPQRALTRAQMEFVAARVSAINECFY